jgi:serine/threonine protein kinase
VSKKWFLKLADFGLARQFDADVDQGVTHIRAGTPLYMAPEVFRRELYSEKADMWSLGVILYELLTFRFPFTGVTREDVARAVTSEAPQPLMRPGLSADLLHLVSALLRKDPAQRPTAKEVLRTPGIVTALQAYVKCFVTIAQQPSSTPLDRLWCHVVAEHHDLIMADARPSQRSRSADSRKRSTSVALRSVSNMTDEDGNDNDDDDDDDGDDNDGMQQEDELNANEKRNSK